MAAVLYTLQRKTTLIVFQVKLMPVCCLYALKLILTADPTFARLHRSSSSCHVCDTLSWAPADMAAIKRA